MNIIAMAKIKQIVHVIIRYKRTEYNMNVMRQTACLVVNQSQLTLLPYLITRRRVGPQT